jgi:luciferase family oxidoreductase group 1
MNSYPLSILDLAPITEGSDASKALANARDLAQHAERWGYDRYWLAEHHNMPGIASAATAVVIAHVGAATSRIRVGAGGIMLPNHAPLVIAEQFGTLDALFPGRVDLGLGRAPGADTLTARALRRTLSGNVDEFPNDVIELMDYFKVPQPGQRLRAVPGAGQAMQFWILGSSLYGAQLAAALGLRFAFASHFAPAMMRDAVRIYRDRFRPSPSLAAPHVMLGVNVFAAETEREARLLRTSVLQAFIALRRGEPRPLGPPIEGFDARMAADERALVQQALECSVVGTPEQVQAGLQSFIDATGAEELMLTAQIYSHAARLRSFEIVAAVREGLRPAQARVSQPLASGARPS